jgi:hypothetical protein
MLARFFQMASLFLLFYYPGGSPVIYLPTPPTLPPHLRPAFESEASDESDADPDGVSGTEVSSETIGIAATTTPTTTATTTKSTKTTAATTTTAAASRSRPSVANFPVYVPGVS